MNENTPVIVGVAQRLYRDQDLEAAVEPIDMMLAACRDAEDDAGATLLHHVDSVRVVRGIWSYGNPAGYVAEKVGASGAQTVGTLFGGNQVQAVIHRTCESILAGEHDLVLITGAENGQSSSRARKRGVELTQRALPGAPDVVIGSQKPEHHDFEIALGIRQAIQVYPMYENALRFHHGETLPQHLERVSALWSRFNDVAQHNPHAWIRDNFSARDIRTPSANNRRISYPYTKMMNANMVVDMSAALVLCSVRRARVLGIAEDRWVYPVAGAEGYDHFSASVREEFYTSPGIRLVGGRVMELAGCGADELDFVDLYSCFPSAVQIAAAELGLPENRDLTVTGGLTFGGGPLNNYVMHSVARTVALLRESRDSRALVTANGGNLYKHAHCIYSGTPPERDFQFANLQTEIDALPARQCLQDFTGACSIESYAVMYGPEGPTIAHVACRTDDGHRTWVNTEDRALVSEMTEAEFCGRRARIAEGVLQVLS